jgi:hypothetical protein
MILEKYQKLDNKISGRSAFKASTKLSLDDQCRALDALKDLLLKADRELKSLWYYVLQRYLRDIHKNRAKPAKAHYTVFIPEKEKPHLEHPIPINKIISEYIDGELTALEAICMPICNIQDADKHHLQGDWELNATWSRPFKRYQLAGIKKEIKNLRGEVIDPDTWTIEDHYKMLGVDDLIKQAIIQK